jgi:hypothetical protein
VWRQGVTTFATLSLFSVKIQGSTPFSYFFHKRGNNYQNAHLSCETSVSSAEKATVSLPIWTPELRLPAREEMETQSQNRGCKMLQNEG